MTGTMILGTCAKCDDHEVRSDRSYCMKEKCYSEISKCITIEALKLFLKQDQILSVHIINEIKKGKKYWKLTDSGLEYAWIPYEYFP